MKVLNNFFNNVFEVVFKQIFNLFKIAQMFWDCIFKFWAMRRLWVSFLIRPQLNCFIFDWNFQIILDENVPIGGCAKGAKGKTPVNCVIPILLLLVQQGHIQILN